MVATHLEQFESGILKSYNYMPYHQFAGMGNLSYPLIFTLLSSDANNPFKFY